MGTTQRKKREEKAQTVVVHKVVPFSVDDEDEQTCVKHPNLIALPSTAKSAALDDMDVRAVKRRRKSPSSETDDDSWEMLGKAGGREWQARRGYQELNVDYFIGVRNKKSDKVKFIEVDRTFCLRPTFNVSNVFDDKVDEKEKKRSYAEQRQELLQSFGGKKSIQRATRYERDKITDDKVDEKTAMKINAAAKEMLTRDAEQGISHTITQTTESTAPPHDNNATKPEDAYPLVGLSSPLEMAALDEETAGVIELTKDMSTVINPGWHPLVWRVLLDTVAQTELSKEVRDTRLKACAYLHYLITLINAPKDITANKRVPLMEKMAVEEPVMDCLLKRFTVPDTRSDKKSGKRMRRAEDNAKIITYAVVMWVTALGFNDCRRLGELAEALGVSLKLLLRYAEGVGCKVRKSKEHKGPLAYSITLKVPLKFPLVRRRQGRPQRKA